MTANELNDIRQALGLSIADLARQLRTPYRTVQDWCSGERPIPGVAAVAAELLQRKDAAVMTAIRDAIKRRVMG